MNNHAYENSPLVHYIHGDIESYKAILRELILDYMDYHETYEPLLGIFIDQIKKTTQYSALYTHISIAIKTGQSFPYFSQLLTYARNYPPFVTDLRNKSKENTSSDIKGKDREAAFNYNLAEAVEFENDLAKAILYEAPKTMFEKVNKQIMVYCQSHTKMLLAKESVIKNVLIKYHLCEPEEFDYCSPLEKFLELLERKLNIPQRISESATLHLIFFNYHHLFDTESDNVQYVCNRDKIHAIVKPQNAGEMFDPKIRGRELVFAKNKTKQFGIAHPNDAAEWTENWHRYTFTPFKYRAGFNLSSPIVKYFKANGVPYIAGPSGTTADCAEGLFFLFEKLTYQEIQEYFNLLAASEVAQGHHAFHEVILPLCLLDWYLPYINQIENLRNRGEIGSEAKYINEPWVYLNYQRTYEDFLSSDFKKTEAYQDLCDIYPQ